MVLYFGKAAAGVPCSRWRNAGTKCPEPRSLDQGNDFCVPLLALVITPQETAPLMGKLECGRLWNSLLFREQVWIEIEVTLWRKWSIATKKLTVGIWLRRWYRRFGWNGWTEAWIELLLSNTMGHHHTFQKMIRSSICMPSKECGTSAWRPSPPRVWIRTFWICRFFEPYRRSSGVWGQRRPLMDWLLRYFRLFKISNQGRLIVAFWLYKDA